MSPVYFCFADPPGFSGQKAAIELILRGLTARGWTCRRLPQPVLDRISGGWRSVVGYLWQMALAWARAFRLITARGAWLCVGLGQTKAAFIRDAVPLLLGRWGLGRNRVIVTLNGSLFMQWDEASSEARWFRLLLLQAGQVTVLGERQRARLLALGIPAERVVIVVNTCELEPVSAAAVAAKQEAASGASAPLRLLHLSSLIDTKGFPEYLEALLELSATGELAFDAVLCGKLIPSEFSGRLGDAAAARQWIGRTLETINRSTGGQARWVEGAAGADKAALFHAAQVFVFPSRYAVEAQPLVLLEAMASGCAIITTSVGEIPTILDESSARFLTAPTADSIAAALRELASDSGLRTRLALAAHRRYVDRYRLERHLDTWETVLGAGRRASPPP